MIVKEEAPWITVAHSIRFDPVRKEVKGYKMDATAHHYFNSVDMATPAPSRPRRDVRPTAAPGCRQVVIPAKAGIQRR